MGQFWLGLATGLLIALVNHGLTLAREGRRSRAERDASAEEEHLARLLEARDADLEQLGKHLADVAAQVGAIDDGLNRVREQVAGIEAVMTLVLKFFGDRITRAGG